MQKEKHHVEKLYEIVVLPADWLTAIGDNICDNIEVFDSVKVFNIAHVVCMNVALTMKYVWLFVLNALHAPMITLNHNYDVVTLGDGQLWDIWEMAIDTQEHL